MIIGRIRGANKVYRAPTRMKDCQDLHVNQQLVGDMMVTTSAWFPTPDEMERIRSGQPIHLHIYGDGHPVVAMSVPDDDGN